MQITHDIFAPYQSPESMRIRRCGVRVRGSASTSYLKPLLDCEKAGSTDFKSNHSLGSTAASRLYRSGMDEQQMCETTGHRYVAVRNHKRTSDYQRADISNLLYNTSTYNNTSKTKAKRSRSSTLTVTSVTHGVLPAVASPDTTQGQRAALLNAC